MSDSSFLKVNDPHVQKELRRAIDTIDAGLFGWPGEYITTAQPCKGALRRYNSTLPTLESTLLEEHRQNRTPLAMRGVTFELRLHRERSKRSSCDCRDNKLFAALEQRSITLGFDNDAPGKSTVKTTVIQLGRIATSTADIVYFNRCCTTTVTHHSGDCDTGRTVVEFTEGKIVEKIQFDHTLAQFVTLATLPYHL